MNSKGCVWHLPGLQAPALTGWNGKVKRSAHGKLHPVVREGWGGFRGPVRGNRRETAWCLLCILLPTLYQLTLMRESPIEGGITTTRSQTEKCPSLRGEGIAPRAHSWWIQLDPSPNPGPCNFLQSPHSLWEPMLSPFWRGVHRLYSFFKQPRLRWRQFCPFHMPSFLSPYTLLNLWFWSSENSPFV